MHYEGMLSIGAHNAAWFWSEYGPTKFVLRINSCRRSLKTTQSCALGRELLHRWGPLFYERCAKNSTRCYKHYQQAYEIDSDTTEILLDFAHAKFEMGDIEESVQLLLENLENHDEDHRMYYRIASYSFTLGHFEKGYNFLHAALGINPKAHILLFEFSPFTENIENITNIIDLYTN